MRETDLAEVLQEYEAAGFRVRFTFDNEVDYIPDRSEPGKQSREEAEHLASQVRRVAKFRGWSDVEVVGQDLEPLLPDLEASKGSGYFGSPASDDNPVKPQGPQAEAQAILAQLAALLAGTQAPAVPERPKVAETDWDRKQRERNVSLSPRAQRFLANSPSLDPAILVNPEALDVGLYDTDD